MKRVALGAATLAVAASIAVPSAQAAVPPIKAFFKVFRNGTHQSSNPLPVIIVGSITLHNSVIGNLACNNDIVGLAGNEFTEGTEKGVLNTVAYHTYECKAEPPCRVKNTKGEEVE